MTTLTSIGGLTGDEMEDGKTDTGSGGDQTILIITSTMRIGFNRAKVKTSDVY